jgi:membrane associated rhomboid family serine protease
VFPLRDTIPSRRVPVVTWTLIGINCLVFVFQLTLPQGDLLRTFHLYGMVPARFSSPGWAAELGYPPTLALPFFTSIFLHGGFFHLLSNMWTLWIFGDNVEDRMGRFRYLVFYLACGLAAGLVHWLTNLDSTVPTIGASGAIAGVLGAYLVLYPGSRIVTLVPLLFWPLFFEIPAVIYLGFWFVTQLLSGAGEMAAGTAGAGGVAWWAHVGGFLAGLFGHRWFLGPPPPGPPGRHFVLVDYPRRPPR